MQKWIEQYRLARARSVPLIALQTGDGQSTVAQLAGQASEAVLTWDVVQGVIPCNALASGTVGLLLAAKDPGEGSAAARKAAAAAAYQGEAGVLELLEGVRKLPNQDLAVCLLNAHRYIQEAAIAQALWSRRDLRKDSGHTVVLVAPSIDLPSELAQDVLVIDVALPTQEEFWTVAKGLYEAANLPLPATQEQETICTALVGLSAFAAEQALALSLTPAGMNMESLRQRKRQLIEGTKGLKMLRSDESFGDLAGVDNVTEFLRCVCQGPLAPHLIVFLDEIEKMLAGATGGDLSGVSADALGQILSFLDTEIATGSAGILFVGLPGTAKSAVAKAAGRDAGIPALQVDMGAAKQSLVGQSEAAIREMLRVVSAVSNGRSLWIATCNSLAILPPELRRRFTLGTFFFDIPRAEDMPAIWQVWCRKFGLYEADPGGFNQDGWTGAEVKQCCDVARRLGCSLAEASQYVVPVLTSARERLEKLRQEAHGRFISACVPGMYQYPGRVDGSPIPPASDGGMIAILPVGAGANYGFAPGPVIQEPAKRKIGFGEEVKPEEEQ